MNKPDALQASKCVLVFGASGTIGRSVVRQLLEAGHSVTAVFRERPSEQETADQSAPNGAATRFCDVSNSASIAKDAFGENQFDTIISCLASRTGAPEDAWLIDFEANLNVLNAASTAGVRHMILLSAICVQKPKLAFQHAKLAFEKELVESGLTYSIIRPTAFFKSLSGQIERVKRGKPYLMFGDGRLTRCKPISDDDLGRYISDCVTDAQMHNRILPIGGPGPAISPREQGEKLFELIGTKPRYRRIPIAAFDLMARLLGLVGRVSGRAADAAEYVRIARYYATESMLVFDEDQGCYSEAATPEFGTETLYDHYAKTVAADEPKTRA